MIDFSRLAASRRRALLAVALLALLAGCSQSPAPAPATAPASATATASSAAEDQPQHLATVTLQVAGRPLVVEVARTEAERRKGMMFRRQLGPDEAMLFVFTRTANLSFWMKNTLVDLDLAYITSQGTVTQVETMKALDETHIPSREPVRFALEAPAGWMKAHGVQEGTRVVIPPEVDRPAAP